MEEDGWQLISSNRTGWSIITITACPTRILQLWKLILLKVKNNNKQVWRTDREGTMCWREFSEGRGCPPLLLLLLGSGFMLLLLLSAGEGLSMKGGLLRKSCVSVCVHLFWCISKSAKLRWMCLCVWSVRTKEDGGGGGAQTFFFLSSSSLPLFFPFSSLSLYLFILSLCVSHPPPPPATRNDIKMWRTQLHNGSW